MNDIDTQIISYLKTTGIYKENISEEALKYVSDMDKEILHARISSVKKPSYRYLGEQLGVSKQAVHSRVQRILNFFQSL